MKAEKVKKLVLGYWRQWRATVFLVVFVILPVKSSLADLNWVPTGSLDITDRFQPRLNRFLSPLD